MKYIISLVLLFMVVGCSTGSKARFIKETTYKTKTDGIIKERVEVYQQQVLPKNTKNIPSYVINSNGVNSGEGATWEVKIDSLMMNSTLFYVIGMSLIVAASIVIFWLKQVVLGISLGVSGVISLFAPTIIPMLGPWVVGILIFIMLFGVAYVIGKWVFGVDIRKAGHRAASKLDVEGKPLEAIAIRRAVDPRYNKDYTNNDLRAKLKR